MVGLLRVNPVSITAWVTDIMWFIGSGARCLVLSALLGTLAGAAEEFRTLSNEAQSLATLGVVWLVPNYMRRIYFDVRILSTFL